MKQIEDIAVIVIGVLVAIPVIIFLWYLLILFIKQNK